MLPSFHQHHHEKKFEKPRSKRCTVRAFGLPHDDIWISPTTREKPEALIPRPSMTFPLLPSSSQCTVSVRLDPQFSPRLTSPVASAPYSAPSALPAVKPFPPTRIQHTKVLVPISRDGRNLVRSDGKTAVRDSQGKGSDPSRQMSLAIAKVTSVRLHGISILVLRWCERDLCHLLSISR